MSVTETGRSTSGLDAHLTVLAVLFAGLHAAITEKNSNAGRRTVGLAAMMLLLVAEASRVMPMLNTGICSRCGNGGCEVSGRFCSVSRWAQI